MRHNFIILIAILAIASLTALTQASAEEYPQYYQSECWRGAEALKGVGWTADVLPDSGIFFTSY
jgi:hypothetical protein